MWTGDSPVSISCFIRIYCKQKGRIMKKVIIILICLFFSCASSIDKSALEEFNSSKTEQASVDQAPPVIVQSNDNEMKKDKDDGFGGAAEADFSLSSEIVSDEDYKGDSSEEELMDISTKESAPQDAAEDQTVSVEEVNLPLYLSADDSNSQASPVIVRRMINEGRWVQPKVIRTYEFLNYYDFNYPSASKNSVIITPELREIDDNRYSLQIGLRGWDISLAERKPVHAVILLDVSGSMAGESIQLAVDFLKTLTEKLNENDRISLVTAARSSHVLFELKKSSDSLAVLNTINIESGLLGDVTNLGAGIEAVYKIADKHISASYATRVLVLSDGGANAGEYSKDKIADYAADADKNGIYLTGVGFGKGFDDSMMNAFTDKGRGAYIFIDSEDEINKMLTGDRLLQLFELQIKDVRMKMVLPKGWRLDVFHGEQVSTVKSEVTPQYLSPNDQMIYHMELVYEGENGIDPGVMFEFVAEYTPLGEKPASESKSITYNQMMQSSDFIKKGDALTAFAEMLKMIEWPLEDFEVTNKEYFYEAKDVILTVQEELDDSDLAEIINLLDRYEFIIQYGESLIYTADKDSDDIPAALGISTNTLIEFLFSGANEAASLQILNRLNYSKELVPQEGFKFLCLSTGFVGTSSPSSEGAVSSTAYNHPSPEYSGAKANNKNTCISI